MRFGLRSTRCSCSGVPFGRPLRSPSASPSSHGMSRSRECTCVRRRSGPRCTREHPREIRERSRRQRRSQRRRQPWSCRLRACPPWASRRPPRVATPSPQARCRISVLLGAAPGSSEGVSSLSIPHWSSLLKAKVYVCVCVCVSWRGLSVKASRFFSILSEACSRLFQYRSVRP